MLILSNEILALSAVAMQLSNLAYDNSTAYLVAGGNDSYEHPDFDEIAFYTDEPDKAIVAKKDDHCYLAFRGSTLTWDDWMDNLDLTDIDVYKDNDSSTGEFCESRDGFSQFLNTDWAVEAYNNLKTCYESCENKDECLILTGHSQGGASATLASMMLYSMNPTVITFGQPPAVDANCSLIPNTRFYRYINSKQDEYESDEDDLKFDPVVYVPTLISNSVHYGYPILLGNDATSVKLLDIGWLPSFFDRSSELDAHSRHGEPFSYQTRVDNLLNTSSNIPISTDGFTNGVFCDRQYHELCKTNYCGLSNVCEDPVEELCVEDTCQESVDCAGDHTCIDNACANGLAESGCPCMFDGDCKNGECDGWWPPSRTCESDVSSFVRVRDV